MRTVVAEKGTKNRTNHGSRRGATRRTSRDRKSTRLNSSHDQISYAVFCLKKKKKVRQVQQDTNDICSQFSNHMLYDNYPLGPKTRTVHERRTRRQSISRYATLLKQ